MEIKYELEASDFDALDAFVRQARYRGWLGLKGPSGPGSAALGRTSLTWSTEGLQVTAPRGCAQTADHIFVMFDGVAGQIIPKRGQSPESLAALAEDLQRCSEQKAGPGRSARKILKWWVIWAVVLAAIVLIWHFSGTPR
jgi:hypothetical protein